MENIIQKIKSVISIKIIIDIIVYAHVILFVYAGAYKLLAYHFFEAQLSLSPLIGNYSTLLVWLVPAIELIIALLLIFGTTKLLGLYCSFSLMFAFTAYIWYMLNFSPSLPCSCGGILNSLGWEAHLVFNIGFTLAAALGIWLYKKQTH